jgi:phage FluMu protein Com
MKEQVKCPWCGQMTVPKVSHLKNDYGDIIERRCSKCGKVLAAYLEKEGDFLSKIRRF